MFIAILGESRHRSIPLILSFCATMITTRFQASLVSLMKFSFCKIDTCLASAIRALSARK